MQSFSTAKFVPHKYFLNFKIAHLTEVDSTIKIWLDFSSGETIDLEIKEVGHKRSPSRHL